MDRGNDSRRPTYRRILVRAVARLCRRTLVLTLLALSATLGAGSTALASTQAGRASIQPLFSHPAAMAWDDHGNLYVVDWGTAYVSRISPQGTLLARFGGRGTAPWQFQNPDGVAVDQQGNVYVADQGADLTHPGGSQVKEFSPTSHLLARWGTPSDLVRFSHPHGVAVDRQGNLYVDDWGKDRIVKFFADGARPRQWAGDGAGPAEFDHPLAITVDAADNVYVVDAGGSRLQKLSPDGKLLAAWQTGFQAVWSVTDYLPQTEIGRYGYPEGVAVDAGGRVYVTDWEHGGVREFSPAGRLLAHWRIDGTRVGEFGSGPSAIAVDRQGRLYVAGFWSGQIRRLIPGGRSFARWL